MELVFTDASWQDVGELTVTSGDLAWGTDQNDFSLAAPNATPEVGALVYKEGSDLGGIVTGYEVASDGSVSVLGDTWTGVLDRRVLTPPSGSAYYTASGDVRDIVAAVIARVDMSGLFVVEAGKVGIITTHKFSGSRSSTQTDTGRYMGAWAAVWQVLSENGCKAVMSWDAASRTVSVSVRRAADHTDAESASAGIAAVASTVEQPVNHLVCLGQGELADRTVLHLYMDEAGKVSTTQSITGIDLREDVYDDSSAADTSALRTDGTKRLQELYAASMSVEVSTREGISLDLGDVVGATNRLTGKAVSAVVTKRIASVKRGSVTYSYTSTVRS